MTTSFRLGRIAGIDVGINWSWLLVFALIAWSLSTQFFPDARPGLSDAAYWTMGTITTILFFLSILAHEIGHAVQARRDGMEVDGITLWLFGGVARFKGMFPSAGAEFRIAIAGPVVSLVIGVGLLVAWWAVDLGDYVGPIVNYLGRINLIILVFNMLPALPLDGGRVLRSALWGAKGDFGWATNLAANIGRGFGFVFIGVGVFLFFVGLGITGIWLAFIGWFLLMAASQEARYLAVRDALGGLRVRDLMVRDPAVVPPGMRLGDFMDDVVWERRFTTYPVVEDGRAVGLLPFRCVAQVPRREWDERTVRDCMLSRDEVPVVAEDADLTEVLMELGGGEGPGRALVVEDDRLVGMISITDLARALETGGLRRRRRAA